MMITPISNIAASIRAMTHDDIAQVSDIERRSYDFPWSHGVFRDCLFAGYECVVIERDRLVCGYGILSVAAGEAHILNLCVDPNFRKHGFGERILNEILVRASRAEVREIFLEVRPSNEAALALYRKKGFHHIAERPAYYQAKGGREDAAVLSKVMKKSG
jgi:ribosomal-protein-alanine N-acetyltransferase